MNTEYGTDYDVDQIGIVLWHQNEDHPLWLTKQDLEQMLNALTIKENLYKIRVSQEELNEATGYER